MVTLGARWFIVTLGARWFVVLNFQGQGPIQHNYGRRFSHSSNILLNASNGLQFELFFHINFVMYVRPF